MTEKTLKLIYAHDTLCGWCYGFIPAIRHFAEQHPDVEIDVVPGGLMAGDSAVPYMSKSEYIKGAEIRLKEITGRKPSAAFHSMIVSDNKLMAASEPPSHAILQMKALAPERAAEFADLLQDAHFGEGKDVNDPATYDELCTKHKLPMLDTVAIQKASSSDPLIAESFERCRKLEPNGYPTIFVARKDNTVIATISSTYDPTSFVAQYKEIRDSFLAT